MILTTEKTQTIELFGKVVPVMINTLFGIAKLNKQNYYVICEKSNELNGQLLHRVIYESVYGTIPSGYVIHHIDGNPTNNNIQNLIAMTKRDHLILHGYERNSTGFYLVSMINRGAWRYYNRKNENKISIVSQDLNELENKVIKSGEEWIIINQEKALNSMYINALLKINRDVNN